MRTGTRSWLRRLHSLSGIVPIGGFLVFHLYENFAATRGAEAYNEMSRRLQEVPFLLALEIGVIAVPILFHGVYGLFLASEERESPIANPRLRRAQFLVQRITGIVALAFIVFHLWTTRLVQLSDHESLDLFYLVRSTVANPWIYALYLGGILSATLHFAIGLWTFAIAWGLASGPAARRLMAGVSVIVFVALAVVGVRAISSFRMAGPR